MICKNLKSQCKSFYFQHFHYCVCFSGILALHEINIFLGIQARPSPSPTFKARARPGLDFIGPDPSLTTTRLEFIKVYLLLLISKELRNSFGSLDTSIILFVFSMLYKFTWYIPIWPDHLIGTIACL